MWANEHLSHLQPLQGLYRILRYDAVDDTRLCLLDVRCQGVGAVGLLKAPTVAVIRGGCRPWSKWR